MTTRIARPLQYIFQLMQQKKSSGEYTLYVVNFKLVDNNWYISYGVKNTITGASNMTEYEAFDITSHIVYVKDTFNKFGFYIRQSSGAISFIKPISC